MFNHTDPLWLIIVFASHAQVDPCFLSLFSTFNMTFPSPESLHQIYFSILSGHTIPFGRQIQDIMDNVTK